MKDVHKVFFRQKKAVAAIALLIGACLFILGLEWPLLLIVLVSVATFLPMPRVFDSWFSRLFLSLFFLYALLQLAAITQLYVYPGGKFAFMGVLLALSTAVLIGLFGRRTPERGLAILRAKDIVALLACVVFILPFSPILRGNDSTQRIGEIAAVQVVDAVTHQSVVVGYTESQTLQADYKVGRYYPTGFHISTAFIEHAIFGNINNMSWESRVILYFMQYMVLSVLLCMALVYTSFTLLARLRQKASVDFVANLTTGITAGVATTVMHLWLFVDAGFLNYYYVCAAAVIAVCFIIDARIRYDEKAKIRKNRQQYAWPVFAYLLLTFGAAASWPLLAPVFLLSASLALLPLSPRVILKYWQPFVWVCVPLAIVALLHVATMYMQSIYSKSNNDLVLMAGVLSNFNVIFLLIGLGVIGLIIARRARYVEVTGLMAVILPFVFLLLGLMALQYFKLGEARYYVIKASMILEMLLLAFGVAYIVDSLRRTGMDSLMRSLCSFGIVLFAVFLTIGTLPNPMIEVRSLFRKQSGAGIPPFTEHDVRAVSQLQLENKLQNFNMTILHYDPAADRYFAHIQIAAWAQTVSKYGIDTDKTSGSIDVFTNRNQSCFGKQFHLLTQPVTTPDMKKELEEVVQTCARNATKNDQRYYVVTDKESAATIQTAFGRAVEVVY